MSDSHDDSWLVRRERGETVEDVSAETQGRYRNLERLVTDLPGETAPAGWQAQVFAKIDEKPAVRPRSRTLWLSGAALAAAAAVVLVLVFRGGGTGAGDERDLIAMSVRHDETVHLLADHRSGGAAVGDTLVARASGAHLMAFRAYRDTGPMIAQCPDGPACSDDGAIELRLDVRGRIRVIAFYDRSPPPAASDMAADLAAANTAGVRLVTAAPLDVD